MDERSASPASPEPRQPADGSDVEGNEKRRDKVRGVVFGREYNKSLFEYFFFIIKIKIKRC